MGRRKLMSQQFCAELKASDAELLWLAPRKYWTYSKSERNIQDQALQLADAFLAKGKDLVIVTPRDFRFKSKDPGKSLNRAETPGHIVYSSFQINKLPKLVGPSSDEQILTTAIVQCVLEGYLGVGQSNSNNSETYFQKKDQRAKEEKESKPQKIDEGPRPRMSKRRERRVTSSSPNAKARVKFDDDDGNELGDHATNNDEKPNYAKEYAKRNKANDKPKVEKGTDDCGDEISAIEIDDTNAFAAYPPESEASITCPSSDKESDNEEKNRGNYTSATWTSC